MVEIAEDKFQKKHIEISEIKKEIEPLLKVPQMDTLVLACTHFSFLKEEIQACFETPITCVDSVIAVAKRASSLLTSRQKMENRNGNSIFLSTKKMLPIELEETLKEIDSFCIQKVDL